MTDQLDEIAQGYVEEINKDYVGLWQIVLRVRRELGIVERAQLKNVVQKIVRKMLDAGLEPVALSISDPVRLSWKNQNVEYVIDRISREWDLLGRDPYPGEIAWFDRKRS